MDRIVLLTGNQEPDHLLVTLLDMVFPDCEVDVVYRITQPLREDGPGPSAKQRLTSHKEK